MGKSSLTGIELLQDNTVYNSENMDYWFKFSNKMLPFLDKDISKNRISQGYLHRFFGGTER